MQTRVELVKDTATIQRLVTVYTQLATRMAQIRYDIENNMLPKYVADSLIADIQTDLDEARAGILGFTFEPLQGKLDTLDVIVEYHYKADAFNIQVIKKRQVKEVVVKEEKIELATQKDSLIKRLINSILNDTIWWIVIAVFLFLFYYGAKKRFLPWQN